MPMVLRTAGFKDANAVLADAMELFEANRQRIEPLAADAPERMTFLILSKEEFRLVNASSPIELPEWFPVRPATETFFSVNDLGQAAEVKPLNFPEARMDQSPSCSSGLNWPSATSSLKSMPTTRVELRCVWKPCSPAVQSAPTPGKPLGCSPTILPVPVILVHTARMLARSPSFLRPASSNWCSDTLQANRHRRGRVRTKPEWLGVHGPEAHVLRGHVAASEQDFGRGHQLACNPGRLLSGLPTDECTCACRRVPRLCGIPPVRQLSEPSPVPARCEGFRRVAFLGCANAGNRDLVVRHDGLPVAPAAQQSRSPPLLKAAHRPKSCQESQTSIWSELNGHVTQHRTLGLRQVASQGRAQPGAAHP